MGSINVDPPELSAYDYIICGGGTSGSVVAGRLAEDRNVSVLVLEAGHHNHMLENSQMAGSWSKLVGSESDWNIETEPSPGANNRRIKATRAKFLGGSSGINGTLCIRGTKQDYDDWNLDGWSGEEVFANMRKAETFHTKAWFKQDQKNHGSEGPLHTEPHELAPISNLIMESFQSQGLDLQHDIFTTGNNPHGCGHAVRSVHKGYRSTAADYLRGAGSNLTVKTEVTVDRVILEHEDETKRATAVRIVDKNGQSHTIKANKEIIVSGGAFCSPPILLRSGIGSKENLKKVGVKCNLDLPGVGKNLMDHPLVFVFYEAEKPGLTIDHLLYDKDALAETYRLWKEEKKGALSAFPFGAFAYARLDERLKGDPLWEDAAREPGRDPMGLTSKQPNIEFFSSECYGGPKQYSDFPGKNQQAFAMCSELFSAKSRGYVDIKSENPMENPVVHHNYLDDPLDLLVLSEACRFGNEVILKGSGTKDVVKGSWPSTLTHSAYTSRDDWKGYVKDHVTTCYHPGGTCKMGRADDPMAVLDEQLRVRGVKGLRVADTSVMPTLNQGHTQLPAYAIGEKCASLIKEDLRIANKR